MKAYGVVEETEAGRMRDCTELLCTGAQRGSRAGKCQRAGPSVGSFQGHRAFAWQLIP